jgi:hypothetical protein
MKHECVHRSRSAADIVSLVDMVALIGLRREVRPVKEGICCERGACIDRSYSANLLVTLFGIEHAIERRPATSSTQVSRVMRQKLRLAARGALVNRLDASGVGG